MNKQKEKGITLIALVITIIVLLILAGVSIAMLTGQNGILTQANNAKIEQSHGAVKDSMSLAYNEYQIEINTASTEKIASTTEVEIKGEEENYLANSNTFMDFLLTKGYITDKTSGKINVENLTGSKQALGNGTGETDIYKVEESNGTYIVNYYDNEGAPEEIWNASSETAEGEEEIDWDKILEEATEKHPEQTESNDIGIGTDGQLVDLDLWYYEPTDDGNGYDLKGEIVGSIQGKPSYSGNVVNGSIEGSIPQYIKKEGEEFLPVTHLTRTFAGKEELIKAPKIPTTVTSMYQTFYRCHSLIEVQEIPINVLEMERTFESCSQLSYLTINAEPINYSECLLGTSSTSIFGYRTHTVIIKGKSTKLKEIADTGSKTYIITDEEYEFRKQYFANKNDENELEELLMKTFGINLTFDNFLKEEEMTREEIKEKANTLCMTYLDYLKYCVDTCETPWVCVEYYSDKNGWNDKGPSELEQMCAELLGFEDFDAFLASTNISRDEFEVGYKKMFEKEEDFLKYLMTGYI